MPWVWAASRWVEIGRIGDVLSGSEEGQKEVSRRLEL